MARLWRDDRDRRSSFSKRGDGLGQFALFDTIFCKYGYLQVVQFFHYASLSSWTHKRALKTCPEPLNRGRQAPEPDAVETLWTTAAIFRGAAIRVAMSAWEIIPTKLFSSLMTGIRRTWREDMELRAVCTFSD